MAFQKRIYFDSSDEVPSLPGEDMLSDIFSEKLTENIKIPVQGMMVQSFMAPQMPTPAPKAPKPKKSKSGGDNYDAIDKIARLIPGEILGAYGAALNTIPLFPEQWRNLVAAACYVLGIIGTGYWYGWCMGDEFKKQRHLMVYMSAFAIWAYSLTGKTVLPWIFQPGFAALLPIIASVIFVKIPLPKEPKKKS
ncbi:MAG TPA: hypothetical protein VFT64_12155 [Rickettsiales bacterium]|nr:hypothetical protein [Rickettsiales bacterium]